METINIASNIVSMVQMPDTCKDCGNTWYLPKSEYEMYRRLCKSSKSSSMPVRCEECRRKRNIKDAFLLFEDAITRMAAISQKAKEGRYAFKDEEFSNDLIEVKRLLKSVKRKMETLNAIKENI